MFLISIVNGLLAQTTNSLPWVVPGLAAWGLAYWQLQDVGSETLGDVVTLIVSVIPLGIAFIAGNVGWARWNGYGHLLALVFLLLGAASFAYFLMVYLGWTKIGRASAVQRVFNEHGVFSQSAPKTVGRVTLLLVGTISTLACVTLLILGGWQLIQGSRTIGLICGLAGLAMVVFIRRPHRSWNFLWLSYSKLKNRTA